MLVLDIQRMSTEDGPGLRTTVFAKGCPLACAWCHNPESIPAKSHVEWLCVRCMGCGSCVGACPQGGIVLDEGGVRVAPACTACGACVAACPTEALVMKGVEYSVDALFATLMKDRAYWGEHGGVTLSGGEITLQWKEAAALLAKLKNAGVHTAVDTCGLCRQAVLEALLPHTDLFLYDLKFCNTEEHKRFAGQPNELILANFAWLAGACAERGTELWVRTPIIPHATDTDENIRGIAGVVGEKAVRWELCAFNNLCKDKYERLGKPWDFDGARLMSAKRMDELAALARAAGATNVLWTGAVLNEEE